MEIHWKILRDDAPIKCSWSKCIKIYFLSVQAVVLDAHCFLSTKCYAALGLEELSCKTCDNGFAFCTNI